MTGGSVMRHLVGNSEIAGPTAPTARCPDERVADIRPDPRDHRIRSNRGEAAERRLLSAIPKPSGR